MSASFFLSDPAFGVSESRAESVGLRPAYYFGFAASLYPVWLSSTFVGATLGNLIADPQALGMDMMLPLYFLALLMGFKGRPNWLTVVLMSGVVSVIVYQTIGTPWHIMSGALAGILVASIIGKPAKAEVKADD